jgi:diadenosine tetraphosphate (Ap4A) HIT family hydrolase
MSLEILWAGWRSSYVATAAAEPPPGEGSVFTRILASGLPDTDTHVVWRGPTCFAICNAFPYVSGHLMVMPYREVPDLEGLTGEEHTELWAAVRDAVVAVKAAYHPEGVNVGVNLGRPAGAGVPGHLHVHVLPRWNGDTNFMTSVGGTRVIPEDLGASAARLRAAWPAGPASP